MRTCLFCDQDWKFRSNLIFFCHTVCGCIGTDGKLAHRKCLMTHQDIVTDICLVLCFICKVSTIITLNHTVLKHNLQIKILQTVQEYFRYMQCSVCSCQNRRRKHFTNRNIDICHTVLKNGLFVRIGQRMKGYGQIGTIAATTGNVYFCTTVQYINDTLLHLLILCIIQCIDHNGFCKNFLKLITDLRNRIRNDGKAALLSFDIFVCDLTGHGCIVNHQFLLAVMIMNRRLFFLRRKRFLTEHFQHSRSAMFCCLNLMLLKYGAQYFQTTLHKCFVKIERFIFFMVKIILAVYTGCVSTAFRSASVMKRRRRLSADRCLQSDLFKIPDRGTDHTLKSNLIVDLHRLFLLDILACNLKSNAVSFCISVRHALNLFLGKFI